jgi:hypothetical protein
LEDRRSVGASSCKSGDGTDQRVQSLMFIIIIIIITNYFLHIYLLRLNKETETQEFSVYILNYYILALLNMESTDVFCVCS